VTNITGKLTVMGDVATFITKEDVSIYFLENLKHYILKLEDCIDLQQFKLIVTQLNADRQGVGING
jgi:hypothetical protein